MIVKARNCKTKLTWVGLCGAEILATRDPSTASALASVTPHRFELEEFSHPINLQPPKES